MKEKYTVVLSVFLAFLLAGGIMTNPDILKTELFTETAFASGEDDSDDGSDDDDGGNEDVTVLDPASAEDGVYKITEKGTYSLSGSFSGQIRIKVDEDEKVKLILNGATVTNAGDAAIWCKEAKKLVISTAEGTENSISVSGEFTQDDKNNVDGAVFSECDITLSGGGTLNLVSESGHGIVSKDTLKLKSGTVNVISGKKGLSAKDEIEIDGGSLSVIADDDALNSSGDIEISGGSMNLSSGDDGMHADEDLEITGGSVYVKESYEGMEALYITIAGGDIEITSTDDGMNAAGGADESGTFGRFGGGDPFAATEGAGVLISGGTLIIDAQGDGIDSNGSLDITGGEVYVTGPDGESDDFGMRGAADGAIDYASYASVSGGTVIAAGSAMMAEGFGSGSMQASILYNFDKTFSGGSTVVLKDSGGNVLASYTPSRSFSSVAVSAPGLKSSGTYCLQIGGEEMTIEMDGITWRSSGFGADGFNSGNQGNFGAPGGFGGPGMAGNPDSQGNFGDPGRGGGPGNPGNPGMAGNSGMSGDGGNSGSGGFVPSAFDGDASDNGTGFGGPGATGMPGNPGDPGNPGGPGMGNRLGWNEQAWKALYSNGVITEDTLNAVTEYFNAKYENSTPDGTNGDGAATEPAEPPAKPDGEQDSAHPGQPGMMDPNGMSGQSGQNGQQSTEMNGGAQPGQGGQTPEMNGAMQSPDGSGDGQSAESPVLPEGSEYMGITTAVLEELLENAVITQEIYDAVIAVIPEETDPAAFDFDTSAVPPMTGNTRKS